MKASSHNLSKTLKNRTRQIVIVLEDLYQLHNASSIIKTCDAFGIQDLYIINSRNTFEFDPEKTNGIEHLIDRHVFEGPEATKTCFQVLKGKGYKIAATSLRPGCISVDDLALDGQLALCFGTEERGLSEMAHQMADLYLRIPMYGLTQSFNVSVTVALSLQKLRQKTNGQDFAPLTHEEQADLSQKWGL